LVSKGIHDLINLPYVSGNYHFKYKLKSGKKGQSNKYTSHTFLFFTHISETVKNHIVAWNTTLEFPLSITLDPFPQLSPFLLTITIHQQVNTTNTFVQIGHIVINLSHYAHCLTSTRKYLLKDAKVNAAVRVTTKLRFVDGEKEYEVGGGGGDEREKVVLEPL
jgi:hypothetical protein